MRLKIIMNSNNLRIPLKSSKQIFQAVFYKKFTMFTFSNIFCKHRIIKDDIMTCVGPIQIFFSSPISPVLTELASNLFTKEISINNHKLEIIEISVEEILAETNKFYVKTLSPIVAYKKEENELKFASPDEEDFEYSITNNLLTKYKLLYQEEVFPFSIKPHNVKKKVIYYKNAPVIGWHG